MKDFFITDDKSEVFAQEVIIMSVSLFDDGTPAAKGTRYFLSGLQDIHGDVTRSVYIMSAERSYSAELHLSVTRTLVEPSFYVIVILLHAHDRSSCSYLPRGRVFYLDGSLPLAIFRHQLRQLSQHIIKGWPEFIGKYHPAAGEIRSLKSRLSEREYMVLQCVLKSYDLAHIARSLGVKYKTAATHKYNLMQKLNTGTLAELHYRLCMEGANSHETVRVEFSREYREQINAISTN
ncbi:helix-turn-helix transcriptional regulator [Salmonella enterica subsp. enterica serovar Saintpaul]|nr:helix-turn-helix transcriptional regulator [Salmonella enterica subsp. enterica serovar Saintpaul]